MDIATYMREARRFDNHRPEAMLDALAHGLMAEVGEVMECVLSEVPMTETILELGDVAWNIVRLADEVGSDPKELMRFRWGPLRSSFETAGSLVFYCSKVSGLLEKHHRFTPMPWELRSEIAHKLHGAWQSVARLADCLDWTPSDVMQANIDKLTVRYAERGLPVREAT